MKDYFHQMQGIEPKAFAREVKMKFKKSIAMAMSVLMAAGMLAGCGSNGNSSTSAASGCSHEDDQLPCKRRRPVSSDVGY